MENTYVICTFPPPVVISFKVVGTASLMLHLHFLDTESNEHKI
jgi:hypothetical protein